LAGGRNWQLAGTGNLKKWGTGIGERSKIQKSIVGLVTINILTARLINGLIPKAYEPCLPVTFNNPGQLQSMHGM
jgi:hypothetical protein